MFDDLALLTGATVISDLDINITTDGLGHTRDANGTVATRTLTLADLGYSGATNANNYSHPNHSGDVTSSGDGATTIGNDKVTYAKMQNVSATNRILGRDTAGAGSVEEITPANLRTMINVADGANNYSLPLATNTVRGGIELFSNTDQSTPANTVTTTSSRTYGLQLNPANQGVVNVPWTNTTYSAGNDLDLSGTTFHIESTLNYVNAITTASNTDFTLTTQGTGDIYLVTQGDHIMMQGHTSNEQLAFSLQAGDQTISSSDTFYIGSGGDIKLICNTSSDHVEINANSLKFTTNTDLDISSAANSTSLVIYNSAGTALKTIYGTTG
jgi:hypothetical protein